MFPSHDRLGEQVIAEQQALENQTPGEAPGNAATEGDVLAQLLGGGQ